MKPNADLLSIPGNCLRSTLLGVVAIVALIGISVYPARAQQASFGPTWEATVTPYLWLPWTTVDVNPSRARLSSASATFDPGQLIEHLSWVPFMGAAELRNGPYMILFDYLHAPVRAGLSTRNIVFGGGGVGLTADTGSAVFLYRAMAQPEQYLDVGAGVRVWGLNTNLSLHEGLLPAVSITSGGAWADPLLAVRYHRELGNGFGATAYGDVGGFGLAAQLDWEVIGTVDYALKPGLDLHAGFRSLNFNQSVPAAGINVHMNGPIVTASFCF